MSRRRLLRLAGLGLGFFVGGCSGEREPSVLLITIDTLRADALGAYGQSPSFTPHLDRMAAEGVVFEQAYTVAPLTLPSHASMLTGLFPPRHGVRDNGIAALPQSADTLAERARAAGLQTAAFLGSVVLDEGFGLEQGFEVYEAPRRRFYGAASLSYAERSADEVAQRVALWLRERNAKRSFFLWAHLWDAHSPYRPSEENLAQAGGNPYLGEVAGCDDAVGRILAALDAEGLDDSTLVIVVADHGESFGEHEEISHGPYVWNTTLRVPLLLRLPGGARGGERVSGLASVVDVFPTALAALGLPRDVETGDPIDGINLLAHEPSAARGAYFESYYGYLNFGWHPLTGWVDGMGKYVHAPQPRYTEPLEDPHEKRNRLGERAQKVSQFRAAISQVTTRSILARDAEGVDPELRQTLQAVGYAAFATEGTSFPGPLEVLPLPDPHALTPELADFQRAQGYLNEQQYDKAEALLRALIERNPENHFASDRLALCLMRMNRHAEAVAPLERVLEHGAGNADTWGYLGACRLVVGEEEKALAAFTHAVELDPNHVQALGGLIHLMEAAGLAKEAVPFKQRFEAVQSRP